MSHITTISTRMVEKEFVLKALVDLDMRYTERKTRQKRQGNESATDIVIHRFPGANITLRKRGKFYVIITDWWGVVGLKKKDFLSQIQKRYAYHATRAKLMEEGFDLVEEKTDEEGKIHLLLRRVA